MRQWILSSTVKLEDSSEDKSYVRKDLSDFSKEMEEDSEQKECKAQHLTFDRK